jgi:citrate lyase subunit beta/citryl-CoA lyase
MTIRSFLFVPGDNESKLAKGDASGADALILDIEDSVAPSRKMLARDLVRDYIAARPGEARSPELWVRMNPIGDGGLEDLAAVVRAGPDGIVVPKVNHPSELVGLSHFLHALELRDGLTKTIRLLPVATETARAPFALAAYPETPLPRLYGMTWGAEDLSSAIGAATNKGPDGTWAFTYKVVRSNCLLAAKASNVAAIETLYADFRDEAGLRADCAEACREGFTGRIAIHPNQVQAINEVFTPSAEDIAHAGRVVVAFASAPGIGVIGIDGKMYDIPHLRQAEALLVRAAAVRNRSAKAG